MIQPHNRSNRQVDMQCCCIPQPVKNFVLTVIEMQWWEWKGSKDGVIDRDAVRRCGVKIGRWSEYSSEGRSGRDGDRDVVKWQDGELEMCDVVKVGVAERVREVAGWGVGDV